MVNVCWDGILSQTQQKSYYDLNHRKYVSSETNGKLWAQSDHLLYSYLRIFFTYFQYMYIGQRGFIPSSHEVLL